MAILGVLFALGLTFMSMMNFESQMIDAERQRGETTPNLENIVDDVARTLGDSLQVVPNAPAMGNALGPSGSLFAEMPGVHNFFAPIEPYRNESDQMVYPWFTDPVAMERKQVPIGKTQYRDLKPNTEWISGLYPNDPSFPSKRCGGLLTGPPCTIDLDCTPPDICQAVVTPVDADGDGIVDAMEIDASEFGISPSQVRALSKTLNPSSKPDGKVYLGLRVIAHGAMVNINDSHPTLLRNILGAQDLAFEDTFHPPYSPLVEEAALRRRNFLPAQQLPATRILGNPLDILDPDNPGGGDYALRLFPPGESLLDASSLESNHRFWPFGPEEIDASVDPDRPIWSVRMDPENASVYLNDDHYDRRHLITTISHDDLLRRDDWVTMDTGGGVYKRVDVFDLMVQANDQACVAGDPLPFDYLGYPNSVADTYRMKDPPGPGDPPLTWCECRAEPGCTFNPRKGRLRLSLPWLQKQLDDGAMTPELEIRLIQDAFTLLLLNARGPEWGHYESVGTDTRIWVPFDADPASPLTPIARTAAALTANLIDFADEDDGVDVPTKVELRSADYTLKCSDTGEACTEDANCPAGETCDTTFGQPLGESVYGLERQPFITEVVASALEDSSDPDKPDMAQSFFGVELFNPYDKALLLNDYELRIDRATTGLTTFSLPIPLLIPGGFVGFYGGVTAPLGSTLGRELQAVDDLWFDETSKIELVWLPPGTGLEIVVDQVDLSVQTSPPPNPLGFWDGTLRSSQRIADPAAPTLWTAPVPEDLSDPSNIIVGESFIGSQRARANTEKLRPVEVLFAIPNDRKSCGGDSKGKPCTSTGDCPGAATCDIVPWSLETAFPTTGSLLLLMRHANSETQAFTSYLNDTYGPGADDDYAGPLQYDAGSGKIISRSAQSRLQIDNGRMPIFDPEVDDGSGKLLPGVHHIDPKLVEPIESELPVFTKDQPGGLEHLPWGQLVFDYFTALPLQSDGPYVDADGNGTIDIDEINDHAAPKVDLDGLRVHGRININAAPWKVLEGLPFVPMEEIPEPFRTRFRDNVLLLDPAKDDIAQPIGDKLAEAMVAYRGLRNIADTAGSTGNYGDAPDGTPVPNGRSWTLDSPMERRGTGFMTVGELANVRHNDASGEEYRIDSGVVGRVDLVGNPDEDYLDAIAVLVSLGDWVTVRSQVFTIYGSLRGEPEEDPGPISTDPKELKKQKKLIEEVNGRALRFRETIDRLPTVIGSRKPVTIGERSITPYNEALND